MSDILYELLYIVDSSLDESTTKTLTEEMKTVITDKGGEVLKESNWGKRRLAYEINKRTEGMYINVEFRAPIDTPDAFNEFVKTRPGILRHLILKVPKAKLIQEKKDAERRQKNLEEAQKEKEELQQARAQKMESTPPVEAPVSSSPSEPAATSAPSAETSSAQETTPKVETPPSEGQSSASAEEPSNVDQPAPATAESTEETKTDETPKE